MTDPATPKYDPNVPHQIIMQFICSDGKMFTHKSDAESHQHTINIGSQVLAELGREFGPTMTAEAASCIAQHSGRIFSILSKYYKAVDYDED